MDRNYSWSMVIMPIGVVFFLSALLLAGEGSARTIIVDDSGGGDYSSIQHAVNASTDGDTIRVFDGTYNENLFINHSIKLIGNSSQTTIIDGQFRKNVITVQASRVEVSNFRIINSGEQYAGVDVSGSNCTISNNILDSNYIGIQLFNAYGSAVRENRCSNSSVGGAGIILMYSNWSQVVQNTLVNVSPSNGIHVRHSHDSIIMLNHCTNSSRGIYIQASHRCNVNNNTVISSEIGVKLYFSHGTTLENNDISGNRYRGIIVDRSNDTQIVHNVIENNSVGIFQYEHSRNNHVHYNRIVNNTFMGISVEEKANSVVNLINATLNYWGDASGPYMEGSNPNGKGDNITRWVKFDPWLDGGGNEVSPPRVPDDPVPSIDLMYLLFGILAVLFICLAILVQKPADQLKDGLADVLFPSARRWDSTDIYQTTDTLIACEFCRNSFEVRGDEKALRIPCPNCGRDTRRLMFDGRVKP